MSHSLDCAVFDIDWAAMSYSFLPHNKCYDEWYPDHARNSCNDDHPINAEANGNGCWRCNAIYFDKADRLRALTQQQEQLLNDAHSALKWWNDGKRIELEGELTAANKTIKEQSEQIAELKRDAERYRALRDMPGNGDELDADIDTLILDATKGEKE